MHAHIQAQNENLLFTIL